MPHDFSLFADEEDEEDIFYSSNSNSDASEESEYSESSEVFISRPVQTPAFASMSDLDLLASAAPPASTAATFQAIPITEDDDNDVQILTAAEAAVEVAAAARRAIKNPDLSRKRKRALVETKPSPTECTICCEACTLVGRHRLVALKCGHLFGRKCIERWITERRTCPNCGAVTKRMDIYPLFSDHVAVVDNSGLEDMTKKYEQEKLKCDALEKEMLTLKTHLEVAAKGTTQLQLEMGEFRKKLAEATQAACSQPNPPIAVACSPKDAELPIFHSEHSSDETLNAAVQKYKPLFNVSLNSARVFSIAPSCSFLCVGDKFGPDSHGVLMIVAQDPRRRIQVPVHTSAVRDMCIHPLTDTVLTVSFDGKLSVTNLRQEKVILKVALPPNRRQGWSCSYSEIDPYAMYCGLQDGRVAKYDMRKPTGGDQGIVKTFSLPERQPVHSIKPFQCTEGGRSTEGLAAATFRGLSVWKNVADVLSDVDRPVDESPSVVSPFSHATSDQTCFSLASNQLSSDQVVVSSRSTPIKHSVFDLSTLGDGQLVPKMEFTGHKAASVLSRSAMWSERNGFSVVASWSHDIERVTLWNVANHREVGEPLPTSQCLASAALPVVDIQHVVANKDWNTGIALFGTMTSSQLDLYCSKG